LYDYDAGKLWKWIFYVSMALMGEKNGSVRRGIHE
jgi:hypothetical protein